MRIDTGVEEGSEISMYYDPMIAKLVTWGKDRQEAMRILDRSFDEYVIKGVTHNLGFGKSIIANQSFWNGDYSTAFIDTFYADGFTGDALSQNDFDKLAVVAHQVKNIHLNQGTESDLSEDVLFLTIQGEEKTDYEVTKESETKFKVTNLATNVSQLLDVENFEFDYASLV